MEDATTTRARLLDRFTADATDGLGADTLLVCAHPDDEIIGAGARLASLPGITLACVTDGALPHDAARLGFTTASAYAETRRCERARALRAAGAGDAEVIDLGFEDQTAACSLVELTRALATLIATLHPRVIVTHPYEGGHPDHDATAFAVHAAVAAGMSSGSSPPAILEMTSYHARGAELVTGEFLSGTAETRSVRLGLSDRARKRDAFACYRSQRQVLQPFSLEHERFRLAPAYDFTRRPHEGRLWYEWFEWGMTGEQWCAAAASAAAQLGLLEATA